MTEEEWRKALNLYLTVADLPPEEREALLHSSSIDSEMLRKLAGALEDAEGRSVDNLPMASPGSASGRIGLRVGRYVVTAALGRGGMGEVFSARHGIGKDRSVEVLAGGPL